jgi:hypothetical protein
MYLKSLVYNMKLQKVAELRGHIINATAQIRNYDTMLYTATSSLFKIMSKKK